MTRQELQDMPAGTPVAVTLDNGEIWYTETRSVPWQLGHGDWVVLLKGKTGGYLLDRVVPTQELKP